MMALLAPALLLLLLVSPAAGEQSAATLQVSNTLASNMVLQRGRPAPIWGWHPAGASGRTRCRSSRRPWYPTACQRHMHVRHLHHHTHHHCHHMRLQVCPVIHYQYYAHIPFQ